MKSFTAIIRDPRGIHARPAGQLAKEAKAYAPAEITITKGEYTVKASQLMKIMGLGVKQGDKITVNVNGGDEFDICNAMKDFFANYFQAEIL